METQWGTRQIRRNLAVRFRIERTIFGSALHALEDEEATKHAPQREKAKRQAMRLSDDGELVPVEADADARDAEISSASRER
jgi:hypothetical protein